MFVSGATVDGSRFLAACWKRLESMGYTHKKGGICIILLIPSLRLLALPSTEDKQRQSAHALDMEYLHASPTAPERGRRRGQENVFPQTARTISLLHLLCLENFARILRIEDKRNETFFMYVTGLPL